eukprot:3853852-Rhodomonas_salina.2
MLAAVAHVDGLGLGLVERLVLRRAPVAGGSSHLPAGPAAQPAHSEGAAAGSVQGARVGVQERGLVGWKRGDCQRAVRHGHESAPEQDGQLRGEHDLAGDAGRGLRAAQFRGGGGECRVEGSSRWKGRCTRGRGGARRVQVFVRSEGVETRVVLVGVFGIVG